MWYAGSKCCASKEHGCVCDLYLAGLHSASAERTCSSVLSLSMPSPIANAPRFLGAAGAPG